MCGLAGYLESTSRPSDAESSDILWRMGRAIGHRGPDDAGIWLDGDAGLGLVHQRLSIVDVSAAGHQPMLSASGRFVLVFNGEIYNHLELRGELGTAAPAWRGHSDTETVLAGFDAWGIDATARALPGHVRVRPVGPRASRLTLARDRLGEKPLYYGWQDGTFLFGSELKALRAHPDFRGDSRPRRPDPAAAPQLHRRAALDLHRHRASCCPVRC